MWRTFEQRRQQATFILDAEDAFARQRGTRGAHPRPIEPLRWWLVGQMAAAGPRPFPRPFEMVTVLNASGYHLFFGDVKSEPEVRQLSLAEGSYIVRVTSPYFQTAERADIVVPMLDPNNAGNGPLDAPYHFDLQPGYAYPFSDASPLRAGAMTAGCSQGPADGTGPTLLRGSLYAPDGTPVAGSLVQVPGLLRTELYRTDQTGQWVLVFPDDWPTGPVTVLVDAADGTEQKVDGVCVVRGRDVSLANTVLSGRVLRGAIPAAGATIKVAGFDPAVTSGADGGWSYYFGLAEFKVDQIPPPAVDVSATLPTGEQLQQTHILVQARGTTQVPPFRF